MKEYDYNDSIEKIKSALFDIYEQQEYIVGLIEDPKERENKINQFVSLKDHALKLLDEINSLYGDTEVETKEDEENTQEEQAKGDNNSGEPIIYNSVSAEEDDEAADTEQSQPNIDPTDEDDEDDEDDDFDVDSTDQNTDNSETAEENINNTEDNSTDDNSESGLTKYYLDDLKGNTPNFAYIPEKILNKIKQSNKIKAFYRQDDNKIRGIIVRSDQFMKLSLSKKRQEGVLKEAKDYKFKLLREARNQQEQDPEM